MLKPSCGKQDDQDIQLVGDLVPKKVKGSPQDLIGLMWTRNLGLIAGEEVESREHEATQ